MKWVLLAGVALNLSGAVTMTVRRAPALTRAGRSSDCPQLRLFTAGVAVVFAGLYLYLYVRPSQVVPFLIFGASLKTWAFIVSFGLYRRRNLSRRDLLEFGISNLAVALLFWAYIVQRG